ncbi:MAG: glutamine synthetase type III, partial [Bacteroidetes bacterium]
NWSLGTDTGKNLLGPSSKAKENLQFLTFFVNVVKAVHDYADILRASIASAGNDYRLGANEAPPAILSIFAGREMMNVLEELEKNATIKVEKGENLYMKMGINKIPNIILDNTDRNRTSPFAFTGNKFEFRAVGSTANCAAPMTVLNTIVAQQLAQFRKEYDEAMTKSSSDKKEMVILGILREYIKASKNVLFEGDNYSDEWVKEAEKRGLPNVKSTPLALDAFVTKKSEHLFVDNDIMNHRELEARHEIQLETYIKKVQIESRIMSDLALNQVIPAAVTYQNKLLTNLEGLMEVGLQELPSFKTIVDAVKNIADHISKIQQNVHDMIEARKEANNLGNSRDIALAYDTKVKSYFEPIRYSVDKLELIVEDEIWPLVKYREMLAIR